VKGLFSFKRCSDKKAQEGCRVGASSGAVRAVLAEEFVAVSLWVTALKWSGSLRESRCIFTGSPRGEIRKTGKSLNDMPDSSEL